MSRRVHIEDLLKFDVEESEKYSTGRLLELYRASLWMDLDWEDTWYEPDQGKAESRADTLRRKKDELRDRLYSILHGRGHIVRKLEGHNLRKIMAKHHLNKDEARKFAETHGICLNPPRRAQKEKESEDWIADQLVFRIQKETAV